MTSTEAACLLAGALVGGTVVYLGILFRDYARAFWRVPITEKAAAGIDQEVSKARTEAPE